MFQPIVPFSGLPGWAILNATLDRQTAVFDSAPEIVRDTEYFEANIAKVTTAEELVSDRRLLRVALGAFGLGDDINNRFLIRKVLEDGTTDPASLANRLSDDRYKQMSKSFGFGELGGARTSWLGFGEDIVGKFRTREFEVAVGTQDESLRLALNAVRELQDFGDDGSSEDTLWFRILGNPPLRQVFETAFNLPDGFGQIDIDRQVKTFRDRASRLMGVDTPADFANAETRDKLIETYLVRDQVKAISLAAPGTIALSLLQGTVSNI